MKNGSYKITPNDKLPAEFKNDPALCFINTRPSVIVIWRKDNKEIYT